MNSNNMYISKVNLHLYFTMMNATTMMAIIIASININTPIIRGRTLPPAAVNTLSVNA